MTYDKFKKDKSGVAYLIFNVLKSNIVVEEEVRFEEVANLLAEVKEKGFSQTATEPDHYALLRSRLLDSGPRYATVLLAPKSNPASSKIVYIMWYDFILFLFHVELLSSKFMLGTQLAILH